MSDANEEGRVEAYEPPEVEDLDTDAGPAITAAGIDSIVG